MKKQFECITCGDASNPCKLETDVEGESRPWACPFETVSDSAEDYERPDWKDVSEGAKNTEQANQPDSGE